MMPASSVSTWLPWLSCGWFAVGLQSWDQDCLTVLCQVEPLAHPLIQSLVWSRLSFVALCLWCLVPCMCSILGCVCVVFLIPVTAVSQGHVRGVPGTSDSGVLGCVCAVFLVLVAMVKLLSLDPLPGWSGDGSISLWYLNPCPLQASHLACVSCRAAVTPGIRYVLSFCCIPTLQSRVLQTHEAALRGAREGVAGSPAGKQ